MEGEQIPKATMNHFIRNKLSYKVSGEFTDNLLLLAKGKKINNLDYMNPGEIWINFKEEELTN